jgi:hypothetical protein
MSTPDSMQVVTEIVVREIWVAQAAAGGGKAAFGAVDLAARRRPEGTMARHLAAAARRVACQP